MIDSLTVPGYAPTNPPGPPHPCILTDVDVARSPYGSSSAATVTHNFTNTV